MKRHALDMLMVIITAFVFSWCFLVICVNAIPTKIIDTKAESAWISERRKFHGTDVVWKYRNIWYFTRLAKDHNDKSKWIKL